MQVVLLEGWMLGFKAVDSFDATIVDQQVCYRKCMLSGSNVVPT